jgi:hypothetical protein
MKRALCLIVLGFGLLPLNGCGSDDDGGSASDAVALCKDSMKSLCAKFYSCFSKEILDAGAEFFGNNEADCVTKFSVDCTTEGVKCDSGETYDASKGQECVSQIKSFSCSEIMGFASGTTTTPAACDQTCK